MHEAGHKHVTKTTCGINRLKSLKRRLRSNPDSHETNIALGKQYLRQHAVDMAIPCFEKALALQPGNCELLNDLGVLYFMQNRHADALRVLQQALSIDPDFALAEVNICHVHLKAGDFEKARALVQHLNQTHPHADEVQQLHAKIAAAAAVRQEETAERQTELSFSDDSVVIEPLSIINNFAEIAGLDAVGLSVVIPVLNEHKNIPLLYDEILMTLKNLKQPYEIIFVDDGSCDGSAQILAAIAARDSDVKVIHFRRNYGQTAALNAGFKYARGSVVITLDGDLQNDPADIPRLLKKMAEGYDLVSGWRKDRKDKTITRKIPSRVANRIINKLIEGTGVQLHDYGCTLKAYKKGIIKNINLYGEMHRFIPVFAAWLGVKVAEIPVNHRPRLHGHAKYNLSRVSRVIFDLIVVRFFADYMTRPIQFFGRIAKKLTAGGMATIAVLAALGLATPLPISLNTIILLTAILAFTVIQTLSIGLLGEIMIRSYFESQKKDYYVVEKIINNARQSRCAA
jgi:glycosyltransferase involved in cell wall biosynthesis